MQDGGVARRRPQFAEDLSTSRGVGDKFTVDNISIQYVCNPIVALSVFPISGLIGFVYAKFFADEDFQLETAVKVLPILIGFIILLNFLFCS